MATAQKAEQERRENVAAAVVASVIGGRFRRRDIGGVQTHDFDLELPGATEALEICAFVDPLVREQWQISGRLDVPAKTLASTWTVFPVRGARVKRLPAEVERPLLTLERHGLGVLEVDQRGRVDLSGGAADLVAANEELARLGVRSAYRAPVMPGEPARVVIGSAVGGFGHSALGNRAVQAVAFKRDNRLKLQAASAARRRHIMVPIDPSAGTVWASVRGLAGTEAPRLPSGVDVAWVIGANGITFRSNRLCPWTRVNVDPRVWDTPEIWRT